MSISLDMLDRPLSVGDYVLYSNNIYKIVEVNNGCAAIVLVTGACGLVHRARATHVNSSMSYLIPSEDALAFKLKYQII